MLNPLRQLRRRWVFRIDAAKAGSILGLAQARTRPVPVLPPALLGLKASGALARLQRSHARLVTRLTWLQRHAPAGSSPHALAQFQRAGSRDHPHPVPALMHAPVSVPTRPPGFSANASAQRQRARPVPPTTPSLGSAAHARIHPNAGGYRRKLPSYAKRRCRGC